MCQNVPPCRTSLPLATVPRLPRVGGAMEIIGRILVRKRKSAQKQNNVSDVGLTHTGSKLALISIQ